MLCEKCKNKQATVHVVENVNGEQTEMYLCEDCASAMQIKTKFSMLNPAEFLSSFFEPFGGFGMEEKDSVCGKCGTRYSDFSRTGYVGCAKCYEQFRNNLIPVIRKMHGKAQHTGKLPKGYDQSMAKQRQYERLNDDLKRAIEAEQYEEAARIRDRIKKLSEGK